MRLSYERVWYVVLLVVLFKFQSHECMYDERVVYAGEMVERVVSGRDCCDFVCFVEIGPFEDSSVVTRIKGGLEISGFGWLSVAWQGLAY